LEALPCTSRRSSGNTTSVVVEDSVDQDKLTDVEETTRTSDVPDGSVVDEESRESPMKSIETAV
jgi:hypothetical protein